jgi:F-type H+-transporting ATPase subunit delta
LADVRIARRYATALFHAAKKENSVEEAGQDLAAISDVLQARPELGSFLASPIVDRAKKLDVIEKIFADRARPITMRLLRLLVDKGRENALEGVRGEFDRIVEDFHRTLHVEITSAVPLGETEVRNIVDRVSVQTGKTIIANTTVDPDLIGGVQVTYGNSMLDGSVRGTLKRLRERLFIDVLKQG